jgi:hypothetical protein
MSHYKEGCDVSSKVKSTDLTELQKKKDSKRKEGRRKEKKRKEERGAYNCSFLK